MKRLANEIGRLTENIEVLSNCPWIGSNLKEQYDLRCIARDAAALDRELDESLAVFLRSSQIKRVVKEDLGKAARRACAFVTKGASRGQDDRAGKFARMLARSDGAAAFGGYAPELLEMLDAIDGDRAAIETLRLAKALKSWLAMESAATRARGRYTHLLSCAGSLSGTLRAINADIGRRLTEAASVATAEWMARKAA
ncbi:MAG: hypothetical protein HY897_11635 [Deltaproteobacteria bacterium]|nr:hypothetical protein [Deltaproteobacteria bacterium]